MNRLFTVLLFLLAFAPLVNAQTPVIDSLIRIDNANTRDTVQIKALSALAIEFSRKDIVREKGYLYKGIALSKQLNTFGLSGLYALMTTAHQSAGDTDSAKIYLDLLETLIKKTPNNPKITINYYQTAGLFYKNMGKPKEALPFQVKTMTLVSDSTTKAGMLLNIGNTYNDLGEIEISLRYLLKSLALFEKVGNKRGQSFAHNSIGSSYVKMQDWKKAKPYYEKSLKLKEELNDSRGVVNTLGGLGNVSMELGDYPSALKHFQKSLDIAKEIKLSAEQGRAHHELAQVYMKMDDKRNSVDHYKQALVFAKQSDDKAWAAWIESNILKLSEETESKASMEAGLKKSLGQFEEIGDKIGIANSHHNLAEFYAKQKDFKNAFEHLQIAMVLDDSTRGEGVDAQLARLEQLYQNEKKDRELALFKKDQELKTADLERKHAVQAGVIIGLISLLVIGLLLVNRYQVILRSKRLTEIEKMRNVIARDLHDDIGSTLSSINILSQLAIRDTESSSKHFTKIAEQSGRMMESMSDIVWSISPGNDSLDSVVSKMKEFAAEILEPKNITYHFTGEDSLKGTTISVDKRKNLFLIFKEAVNNAAKYSGATDLEIKFLRQGNTLSLCVSDNGNGFEPETVKAGNGLKNMKERARALSARFDFVTRVSGGTSIALEVPIT